MIRMINQENIYETSTKTIPKRTEKHNPIEDGGYIVCATCGLVLGRHIVDNAYGNNRSNFFEEFTFLGSYMDYKDATRLRDWKKKHIHVKSQSFFRRAKRNYDQHIKFDPTTVNLQRNLLLLQKVCQIYPQIKSVYEQIVILFKKVHNKTKHFKIPVLVICVYYITLINKTPITLGEITDGFKACGYTRLSNSNLMQIGFKLKQYLNVELFPKTSEIYLEKQVSLVFSNPLVVKKYKGFILYEFRSRVLKEALFILQQIPSYKKCSRNQYNLAGAVIYHAGKQISREMNLPFITQKRVAESIGIKASCLTILYSTFLKDACMNISKPKGVKA